LSENFDASEICDFSDRENPASRGTKTHRQRSVSDQVIRENPASRGTETSAEVLVGPPGRMVSNAGQQQWYEGEVSK
jgi:hypothetical protein